MIWRFSVFALGDLLLTMQAPSLPGNVKVRFIRITEEQAITAGSAGLLPALRDAAAQCDVSFLFLALLRGHDRGARSRARIRLHPDADRDLQLRGVIWELAVVAVRLPGFRVAALHYRRSFLFNLPQHVSDVAAKSGFRQTTLACCNVGGKHAASLDVHWSGFEERSFRGQCDGQSACRAVTARRAWPVALGVYLNQLVLNLAERMLLVDAARYAPSVHRAVFVADGRVPRHVARGPAPRDERALRRQEDAASQAGMRDPAQLREIWPALWNHMGPIGLILESARASNCRLQGLHSAFGAAPARHPPTEADIQLVRKAVAAHLDLSQQEGEAHHDASPWRYRLVEALGRRVGDPDSALPKWLRVGAPMGVREPIEPGGLFPRAEVCATRAPEDLWLAEPLENHGSFLALHGEDEPPGFSVVEKHVAVGFGLLFTDQDAAEQHYGQPMVPSPLGNVVKWKEHNVRKDRVIMDLTACGVNQASTVPERQVLPLHHHHACDLAELSATAAQTGGEVYAMILDFADAFMGLPLHLAEHPYNCCSLPAPVRRDRCALYPQEPTSGRFVVWRVLGFGGRPNPLVFARAASFASRTAQALLRTSAAGAGHPRAAPGRMQTYVDDPALLTVGRWPSVSLTIDLVITWWLVLGIPLSWRKGTLATGGHQWIGVRFWAAATGVAAAALPADFLKVFYEELEIFASGVGSVEEAVVKRLLGRAGRVAFIVPDARPFVSALWAAFAAATGAVAKSGRREAPPGRCAAKRFKHAARWLRALVAPHQGGRLFPLESRYVLNMTRIQSDRFQAQFDASPWGGGAVLWEHGRLTSWWAVA